MVVLGSSAEGKVNLVALWPNPDRQGYAGKRFLPLPAVGGGGGGRPDMAQAGGKQADKLPEALKLAREIIEKVLT